MSSNHLPNVDDIALSPVGGEDNVENMVTYLIRFVNFRLGI
jgi:hypothetical protein